MANQQLDKSQLNTRLLQKIFIAVITATYLLNSFLQVRTARYIGSRQYVEILLLLVVPVGYFVISYIINSKKRLKLFSVYQSLVASVTTYAVWETLISLIQNWHKTYTANLKIYYAAAIVTGFLLILVLCYLRVRKKW